MIGSNMRSTLNGGTGSRPTIRITFKLIALTLTLIVLAACGQVSPGDPTTKDPTPEVPVGAINWSQAAVGYDDSTNSSLETAATSPNFVVKGSGTDIWGERDEFYYVYTALSGDGSMSVRVHDFAAAHEWSKAGIMLRESLEPDSRNVLIHISGENGSVLQARYEDGGLTTNSAGRDSTHPVGGWVRLTRSGTTVVGETSTDGTNWRELGRYEIELQKDLMIGLAVTAHAAGEIATATFSDLKLWYGANVPAPETPAPAPTPAPTPTPTPTPPSDSDRAGYDLPPATLFVDGRNGNDSNSGRSVDSALRTVQRATNVAKAGDVVYIRGGTYPMQVYFRTSGTASQPIVWASYPGETAIFDGSGEERGHSMHRLWVEGASHNHFVNFVVRNGPRQGMFIHSDASDNLFYGIVSHGNNGSGIQNYGGNRNRFEYIVVYDNYDAINPHNGGLDGEDADGIGITFGNDNVIRHVVSFNNSDDGFDTWRSTNTLIEYSIAFQNGRGKNGNGNGFKLGGANDSYTIARFNIAFENRSTGFTYNRGRFTTIHNNTSHNNGGHNFVLDETADTRNNLSIGGSVSTKASSTYSHNSWNLGITDPRVMSTDPSNADYLSLSANSPAINAGVDVDLPFTGAAPDVGALQHSETISDLVDNEDLPLSDYVRNPR